MQCLPDDWGDGWDNVWLGTSAGSKKGTLRIPFLLEAPAKIHFVSLEPLYEEIDLALIKEYSQGTVYTTNALKGTINEWDSLGRDGVYNHGTESTNKLDWVIVGGESGNENGQYKYRPCELSWIEKIVNQCNDSDTPVFVKQLGTFLAKEMGLKDRHGGDIEEFPEYLKIRQFPKF